MLWIFASKMQPANSRSTTGVDIITAAFIYFVVVFCVNTLLSVYTFR